MTCGHKLAWYDLIPVVSFLMLKGRCRYCGSKINRQYPLIELANGAAYLWIYFVFGWSVQTFIYCAFASALIVVFMIDLRHLIVPNSINLFILILGILNVILNNEQWLFYAVGFFAASVPLLILSLFYKGKLGGGDIKLMAVAGLIIGWNVVIGLFLGAFIGLVVSIGRIVAKKADRKALIPFAPFLTIGLYSAILYGDTLMKWYLSFFA